MLACFYYRSIVVSTVDEISSIWTRHCEGITVCHEALLMFVDHKLLVTVKNPTRTITT